MKQRPHCLILTTLLLLSASLPAQAEDEREMNATFEVESDQVVRLDFPVGELRIEAGSGSKVTMGLTARCRWSSSCGDSLERLEIVSSSSDRRLLVEIDGYPSWKGGKLELEAEVTVPADHILEIDMGVGHLEVSGTERDLRIDMGVGEVDVHIDRDVVESINLDAGVGDVQIMGAEDGAHGRRSLFVGGEVYWDEGPGDASVYVDLGVGDAAVWLD